MLRVPKIIYACSFLKNAFHILAFYTLLSKFTPFSIDLKAHLNHLLSLLIAIDSSSFTPFQLEPASPVPKYELYICYLTAGRSVLIEFTVFHISSFKMLHYFSHVSHGNLTRPRVCMIAGSLDPKYDVNTWIIPLNTSITGTAMWTGN